MPFFFSEPQLNTTVSSNHLPSTIFDRHAVFGQEDSGYTIIPFY